MLLCGFIGGIVLLSFKQAPRRERWQGVSCLPGKTENLKKQIADDLKLTASEIFRISKLKSLTVIGTNAQCLFTEFCLSKQIKA